MGTILRIRSRREDAIQGDLPREAVGRLPILLSNTSNASSSSFRARLSESISSVKRVFKRSSPTGRTTRRTYFLNRNIGSVGHCSVCSRSSRYVRGPRPMNIRRWRSLRSSSLLPHLGLLARRAFKFISIRNHSVWDSLLAMLLIFAWTLMVPPIYREPAWLSANEVFPSSAVS
jgi:hypothetical protein